MRHKARKRIEVIACRLFGVTHFEDVYERIARSALFGPPARAILRKRLADDIRNAPFLFIHVPKNGGHSIQSLIYRSKHPHVSIRHYRSFFGASVARKPVLAVVRGPVERFLSSYDFAVNRGGSAVAVHARALRRMGAIASIDDYLDFLERHAANWLQVDASARPQSWYVLDGAGRIGVTDLCLLDGENSALIGFLAQHGLSGLPHANRTKRSAQTLSAAQLARVRRLYADDFALHRLVVERGGHAQGLLGTAL